MLKNVNQLMGLECTSWVEWLDVAQDKIQTARLHLLQNPNSEMPNEYTGPAVNLNYQKGETMQTFGAEYEYALNDQKVWHTCNGETIKFQPKLFSQQLWVRKKEVQEEDSERLTTFKLISSIPEFEYGGIQVRKSENGYHIANLNPNKLYEVQFSKEPLKLSYDTKLSVEIPRESYTYDFETFEEYKYVYIRNRALQNTFASRIGVIQLEELVTVTVNKNGEGVVTGGGTYEEGTEVILKAEAASGWKFEGWYQGDVCVSTEAEYAVTASKDAVYEARFADKHLKGISLNQSEATIETGKSLTLTVSYTTEDTLEDRTVTWSSNNVKVAEVVDGVVTGKAEGYAEIQAKVGTFTAICKINVKSSEPTITPRPTVAPEPVPTQRPLPDNVPNGSKWEGNTIVTPNGTKIKSDGTIVLPGGAELTPNEEGTKPSIDKEGSVTDVNSIVIRTDFTIVVPGKNKDDIKDDTTIVKGEGSENPVYDPKQETVTIKSGNIVYHPNGMIQRPEVNSIVDKLGIIKEPDGTIITTDGVTHRIDGGKTSYDGSVLKPAIPEISNGKAGGNTVDVVLNEDVYGASGYDFVISKNINCINDKDYLQVSKNQLVTKTSFHFITEGDYYVYCHAWVRNQKGKKEFSDWSKAYKIHVSSITPSTPKIKSIEVKGRNVTVTYTKTKGAKGYDIVLGKKVKKVYGQKRPVEYGTYVKKVKDGNEITVTFKNVKPGSYYVGLHAWNRSRTDKKKVFSRWSPSKKIRVKK